jgi:hypothetical protein
MLLTLVAGLIKNLMGLAGGQPLIPQVNGHTGQLSQFGGKVLRFGRSGTLFAGKMERIAYHDPGHAKPPCEPCQGSQIVARIPPPFQSHNGLRRQPEFVGHSHTDAFRADVEG